MYLKLTNNQPEIYSIGQLLRDNQQTSFPKIIPKDVLSNYDVYTYTRPSPPLCDTLSHYLADGNFEKVEGEWILPYVLERLPLEQATKNVRSHRDVLLQESDWIVTMHSEKGTNIPEEWVLYRQALRDITLQPEFPYSVAWPTKPTSTQ